MTSKATYNPYALLTDDLVENALYKQFGSDVHLESYKVCDFTKKGDNFTSIVTNIQVDYKLDIKRDHISYIVKLHNDSVTDEAMVQYFRFAYLREPIVLGPILSTMNKILDGLNEQPIKAPRCLSSCDVVGKEVLLSEDLRTDGFIMIDKMKGMDFKHANFVVKELGRFHACSILYVNQLKGSTLEKLFPPFNDAYFKDPDCLYLDRFSHIRKRQLQLAIDILNCTKEYDNINKWWNNLKNFCGPMWFRNSDVSEKFDVLVHGDYWSNNLLFRYNQVGEPMDIRLVDFQFSRRSSPATDLTLFFYTSLTDETREKHEITLLQEYFLSFSRVLLLAHQPVPFTFKELREEFRTKMIYGCLKSMLVLPNLLVRPEDALGVSSLATQEKRQKFIIMVVNSPVFKMRFLSMFDSMTEAGVFGKTRTIYNPCKLLTEDLVEEAVKNDVGEHAQLKAFEVRNFKIKRENYNGTDIAIKVFYDEHGIIKNKIIVVPAPKNNRK